jgi:hypothetical protein
MKLLMPFIHGVAWGLLGYTLVGGTDVRMGLALATVGSGGAIILCVVVTAMVTRSGRPSR